MNTPSLLLVRRLGLVLPLASLIVPFRAERRPAAPACKTVDAMHAHAIQ